MSVHLLVQKAGRRAGGSREGVKGWNSWLGLSGTRLTLCWAVRTRSEPAINTNISANESLSCCVDHFLSAQVHIPFMHFLSKLSPSFVTLRALMGTEKSSVYWRKTTGKASKIKQSPWTSTSYAVRDWVFCTAMTKWQRWVEAGISAERWKIWINEQLRAVPVNLTLWSLYYALYHRCNNQFWGQRSGDGG